MTGRPIATRSAPLAKALKTCSPRRTPLSNTIGTACLQRQRSMAIRQMMPVRHLVDDPHDLKPKSRQLQLRWQLRHLLVIESPSRKLAS